MNFLHPIFVELSPQVGSRVDIGRLLPVDIDKEDPEFLIEMFSEPPRYTERIAHVSTRLGQELIRGKNWTELMIKCYRIYARIFSHISAYVAQTLQDMFREKGLVPMATLGVDPDTLHRIIELDYELNENTYGKLIDLYNKGIVAPCATIPFHIILPALKHEFDIRFLIRAGLLFYWPILKSYHQCIADVHKEKLFVACFWFPEGGYNNRILQILHEEFSAQCKADGIKESHLIILLDNAQAEERDNDILMKSWNILPLKSDKKDFITVVFKDRNFSDWVTFSNPSVKKLLDRTIAKMDSELNEKKIDYGWAHFENISALTYTIKAASNFEQKVIKLTELGYLPVSPDIFIRRKLLKKYARSPRDTNTITLKENTAWNDWHHDNVSLGRWEGTLDSNAEYKLVDENHPYIRVTPKGEIEEPGPQCWKLAFNRAVDICAEAVIGDRQTLQGGMLGVLASLVSSKEKKIIQQNVEDFILHYSLLHWREHFLQNNYSEPELTIEEIVGGHLLKGLKNKLSLREYAVAATAAQAYYFCLDARKSSAVFWENFDQRAVYQNVAMLVLGMSNAIHVYHWINQQAEAKKIVKIMKDELIQFETAYQRYNLAEFGITEIEWKDAIKSAVDDCSFNVVERAARRIAARHLRPLGYRKEFTLDDENVPTSVGHIWSGEVINSNYTWENRFFCGLHEE